MADLILRIDKISKSFEKRTFEDKEYHSYKVLNDISLDVNKGDIFGIIGLSGEGKSTLVRCINGLEKPDDGKILYYSDKEYEVLSLKADELRKYRQEVSMIFQDFNLFRQKTVYQNIEYPFLITNQKKKDVKEKVFDLLRYVGLEDKANSYPEELSGGQKQRVAIARALALNPKILLCDECTSALDPNTSFQILDLLKKLNKERNLTIIIIAHQMSVIERICNKVAILSDHEIVEQGNMTDVFLNPQSESAKNLIFSGHVVTKLQDENLIELIFNGNPDIPLITNIIQDCNILVSIVYANSWVVEDKVYGQMIIKLPYYEEDILKLKTYLDQRNIEYKEVSHNELSKHSASN